jgi:hypothetical protein
LDRKRDPLQGDEIRACWQPRPIGTEATETGPLPIGRGPGRPVDHRTPVRRREFVEVGAEPMARSMSAAAAGDADGGRLVDPPSTTVMDAGWSLWGDADF